MFIYLFHFIISFIATVLFQLYLMHLKIAISLWICWSCCLDNISMTVGMDLGKVGASFLGSLILGLMSHTMSRRYKQPVIIFIVPGIIPLVPGGAAYEATRFLVSNDYTNAVNTF